MTITLLVGQLQSCENYCTYNPSQKNQTIQMASILPRAAPRAFRLSIRASVRPQLNVGKRPATPLFRRYLSTPAEQPRLRLGSVGKKRD